MENQVDIDMGGITLFKSLPLRKDMQIDAQIYQNEYTNTHTWIRKVSVKTDHYFDQGDFGVTVPFCFQ